MSNTKGKDSSTSPSFIIDERPRKPGPTKAGEVRAQLRRIHLFIPADILALLDLEADSRGIVVERALKLYFALKDRIDKKLV